MDASRIYTVTTILQDDYNSDSLAEDRTTTYQVVFSMAFDKILGLKLECLDLPIERDPVKTDIEFPRRTLASESERAQWRQQRDAKVGFRRVLTPDDDTHSWPEWLAEQQALAEESDEESAANERPAAGRARPANWRHWFGPQVTCERHEVVGLIRMVEDEMDNVECWDWYAKWGSAPSSEGSEDEADDTSSDDSDGVDGAGREAFAGSGGMEVP